MLLWPDGKSRTSKDDEHCEADTDYLQYQLSQMWDDGGSSGTRTPNVPPLLTKSKAGKVLYRADLASFAFIKRGEIG